MIAQTGIACHDTPLPAAACAGLTRPLRHAVNRRCVHDVVRDSLHLRVLPESSHARQPLRGRRILVVEDDYLLAESLNDLLAEAGAKVVGPVGNVPEALSLVTSGIGIDGALLDVNVRGQAVFPVADALLARGVPFSFCSGYDRYTLPPRYAQLSYCMKPYNPRTITALLSRQHAPVEHH